MCPGFAEPRSRSELASADQWLKFCDDTPFTATLPTLNNWRDLDLDCLAASFLVQWTQAYWNAGKRQCGVNGVQAFRPAGTQSRCSRYGELPTVNLVRVAYVLTVINTICFSTWLHKHKLCLIKFWNSNRNHNALREMFSSHQHSLGRHPAKTPPHRHCRRRLHSRAFGARLVRRLDHLLCRTNLISGLQSSALRASDPGPSSIAAACLCKSLHQNLPM